MNATRRFGLVILALLTLITSLTGQPASAQAPATERHIGRISTTTWATPELTLYLYGVYFVGPATGAHFYPAVMPPGINQAVSPHIRIPDDAVHRYRLDCQVDSGESAGTTTVYRLSDSSGSASQTSTQPQGAVTVSFQVTVDLDGPAWRYWLLTNTSGRYWTFSGCDVYELLA